MSSRHRKPRSLPLRPIALAAGALTVAAGVGTGLALDDDRPATVASEPRSAAGDALSPASPTAGETTAAPSPSATRRSPSPKPEKSGKTATAPRPERTTAKADRQSDRQSAPARAPEPVETAGQPAGTAPEAAATGVAAEVLRLVNQARANAGCAPVTADERLDSAAQKYSRAMASSGNFSHTGTDGSDVSERVEREGYTWSTVGENIAMGQPDAAAVMDGWMNSEGHRANILNCDFKEMGLGLHESGGPWWTQVFATSR
ncbi:CAP domain-containing protein [Streptomyces sp. F63]|uniref:CAP domain-containing protein n=1 Tax=Streptomyces sp. F63 TaxID=2824887 RepID=UPI001B37F60F|nr:CAP domain-containing protein [Streptomyces sp. F63]MBQ0985637.1 CAP domain-containing protein [Streptomyces sp. F63]